MIRKLLRNRSGETLVELVVSFMLLLLFCVAMVYVITASLGIYRTVTGRADAQTVCETLMEKITGEISGAQGGVKPEFTLTIMNRARIEDNNKENYLTYDTNTCIAFCNRSGSPMYMTVITEADVDANPNSTKQNAYQVGYLLIHYRPVSDNVLKLDAVDWTFDPAVYNGYIISKLNFTIVTDDTTNQQTNVVRVDLELKNEKTGFIYSDTRYVECYNFVGTDVSKISYGGILTDKFDPSVH